MRNFLTKAVIGLSLAWAGASGLLTDWKDFFLKPDEMPKVFMYGAGALGLLLTKWVPNIKLGSGSGNFMPWMKYGLNYAKYLTWRSLPTLRLASVTAAVPYILLNAMSMIRSGTFDIGKVETVVIGIAAFVVSLGMESILTGGKSGVDRPKKPASLAPKTPAEPQRDGCSVPSMDPRSDRTSMKHLYGIMKDLGAQYTPGGKIPMMYMNNRGNWAAFQIDANGVMHSNT